MSDFVRMEWADQALKECYYDGMRKKGVEVEDNVAFYQLTDILPSLKGRGF